MLTDINFEQDQPKDYENAEVLRKCDNILTVCSEFRNAALQ